ncbi:ABC transporter permease [Bacillus infantis]|uniref:ABC transporter permease n=1 Tax=Bacillus infantis TaxID=324767 RepID=UPI002155183E|nr:ABC transporter permease [Bacillus infantis]MCR6611415.1 ABC transporter permease [Bacillus infantis]
MGNLIKNEWIKIFKRTGTLVMIGLVIFFTMVYAGFEKYDQSKNGSQEPQGDWKQTMEEGIKNDKVQMEENFNSNLDMFYKREIAIKEYQIENDIPPQTEYSVWSFVNDAQALISFAGLFTIIVAAGIVASEFSWGTIKLLLIRPISRSKILLSKYIAVFLFGLLLLALIYGLSTLLGLILFGLPGESIPHLAYSNGAVVEKGIAGHLAVSYLLASVDVLLVATMAFMISAVFRNSSLAIGLSLFLLFTGSTATVILAGLFDWAKYLLFANTNLTVYFDGVPPVEGMTLTFSVIVLLVYFLIFHALAFWLFNKRDVSA